ncbi:putative family protein [Rosellinia necatrix]|uniref:Putative family protein n=1 Tax=Rosellinia necatrix TaxID=77044 RepID=A0A1S7ULB5_ROSNE|nr:putative family protein [Rosellinia necatrix]
MSQRPVKIGVYVPHGSQLLDLACVDVLHMMSREYLSTLPPTLLPRHMAAMAPSVQILYITTPEAKAGAAGVALTSDLRIRATHAIGDAEVRPGELDVLLVPGPDPNLAWDEGGPVPAFLAAHAARPAATDVLSVCTGALLCGAAGLLDGRAVCGPRGLQDLIRQRHPTAKLVGEKYRWVQDGNLWSSGGITNGNDLVAAYARAGKHFPSAVVEIACKMADVGDRAQRYEEGQAAFTLKMAWIIIKGFFIRW